MADMLVKLYNIPHSHDIEESLLKSGIRIKKALAPDRSRIIAFARTCAKDDPSVENLRGTYEEMYSNWKNKMAEAAGRNDVYSSFMNLLSLQWMFYEIAECIAVDGFEIMDKFNPKHFESMTEYVEDYNKEVSEEI